MLLELSVENYAVIERVRVHFHSGLNLLTGETGSGKSIVVDALGLLFGGRSSAEMLRSGTERARISAIFEASGKSRAFAGGRPVTVGLLREVAPFLGDIHGQHDQQLLFSPDAQRDMLDAFASAESQVNRIGAMYRQWRAAGTELEDLERSEQEKLRLVDLWSFQRKEIEAAALQAGEEASLENERRVLQNVQRL